MFKGKSSGKEKLCPRRNGRWNHVRFFSRKKKAVSHRTWPSFLKHCEKSPMNEGRIWIQPIILKTNISDEKWSKQYYYSQLLSLFFRVVRRFKSELSFFFLYVHKYPGGREVVDVTVPIISQTAFEWETPTLYLLDRDLESN